MLLLIRRAVVTVLCHLGASACEPLAMPRAHTPSGSPDAAVSLYLRPQDYGNTQNNIQSYQVGVLGLNTGLFGSTGMRSWGPFRGILSQ